MNRFDPEREPFRWMAEEIRLNREHYLQNHPEERHVARGSFSMADFHRPLNGTQTKKQTKKPRRKGR